MSVNKNQVNKELQLRGNFFQGPNEIWELPISLIAKSIWCYILSRSPEWNSSYNNLARNLDLDERTVAKHIATLEAANMLIVTKQANNAAGFELLPPSKWVASAGPASHVAPGSKNAVPHSMQPSTAKNAVQVPHEMGHTKEEILNTSLAIESSFKESQEENSLSLPDLTKLTQPTKNPARTTPTFAAIVRVWVQHNRGVGSRAMDFISGNQATESLSSLIETCKSQGLPQEELQSGVLLKEVFGSNPKFISKNERWLSNTKTKFEKFADAAYSPIVIQQAPQLSEAELMRAYVKQFPVLDTSDDTNFKCNDDEEI